MAHSDTITVKLKKSMIGKTDKQKSTIKGLGLKGVGSEKQKQARMQLIYDNTFFKGQMKTADWPGMSQCIKKIF